jgi:hypothetical protein
MEEDRESGGLRAGAGGDVGADLPRQPPLRGCNGVPGQPEWSPHHVNTDGRGMKDGFEWRVALARRDRRQEARGVVILVEEHLTVRTDGIARS